MLSRIRKIDNKKFFTELHWLAKWSTCFIHGDLLILLPFLTVTLVIGFFSLRLMGVILGTFIAVRYLGEMVYWLLQQFSDRSYRPYDFGLKKLDNNAIYILYQTFAIVWATIGIVIVICSLIYR